MYNIKEMNGYEFEELIADLFKQMGFIVEVTKRSGDGGVDVIAINKEPIYSGKYLIQCKNWSKSIGEPPIRDLYGKVLSENANKGILITSSSFTKKAIEFADGKNIELINAQGLMTLLDKYMKSDNVTVEEFKTNSFLDFESFEKEKYHYLKKKIEEDPSDIKYYQILKEFFHSYILNKNIPVLKNGLIDEYIHLNNEYNKRFCKRTKLLKLEGFAIHELNAFLYLLKGDLTLSLDNLNYTNLLREFEIYPIPGYEKKLRTYRSNYNPLLIRNIYSIFSNLDYSPGKDILGRKFISACKTQRDKIANGYWHEITSDKINDLNETLDDWKAISKARQQIDVYTPVSYKVRPAIRYNDAEFSFTYTEDYFFTFDEIHELWGTTPSTQGLDILLSI